MTKTRRIKFLVEETGDCKKVFIPRGYCTVFLQGAAKDHIEIETIGDDVEIQNLDDDMPCQKMMSLDEVKKLTEVEKR